MDQDYHYFATYLAAMISGRNHDKAALIARTANYVDFFNEQRFRGYWVFKKNGVQIAQVNYPRYTYQANYSGQAVGAEGLWAAFHFLPGNYQVQKQYVKKLPDNIVKEMSEGTFKLRNDTSGDDVSNHWRLTRPLSALSRAIVTDMHLLAKNGIKEILFHGPGLKDLIDKEKDKYIEERFFNILTGIRAHVIADTWAHQDFAGILSVINTYYDVDLKSRTYGIKYKTPDEQEYTYTVLRHKGGHPFENMPSSVFTAVPAIGSHGYLGHGWMGHLPDYSFISYQYRPYWKKNYAVHERNNPEVYLDAFYDILNFLYLAEGKEGDQAPWRAIVGRNKDLIKNTIKTVWSSTSKNPRVVSSDAWRKCIKDIVHQPPPPLNTFVETGDHVKLAGEEKPYVQYEGKKIFTAYGTFTLEIMNSQGKPSDFYLFQLAADYHFQYVKSWLSIFKKHDLSDSWSVQPGPLGSDIEELTDKRVKLLVAPPLERQQHIQASQLKQHRAPLLERQKHIKAPLLVRPLPLLERQKGGPLRRSPLPKVDSKPKE